MSDSSKRPGAVTFVAIVLFVFGGVYILSAFYNGSVGVYAALNPEPADPRAKIQFDDTLALARFLNTEIPGFVAITVAIGVFDILFGLAQLYCGSGVLRLRPAARKMTMALVLLRLAYALGFDAFSAFVQLPAVIRFMELHPPEIPQQGAQQVDIFPVIRVAVVVLLVFGMFMQVFIASLIVLLLRTRIVKAAFAGMPPSAELPPVKPPAFYTGYEEDETQPA